MVEGDGNLQLGNTIFLIIWQLLFSNSAEIPEDHSTVIASTAENCLFEWVPSEGGDRVSMAFKRVELVLEVSQIPETNSLVARGCGQNEFGSRVECQSINRISVTLSLDRSFSVASLTNIENLEGQVV